MNESIFFLPPLSLILNKIISQETIDCFVSLEERLLWKIHCNCRLINSSSWKSSLQHRNIQWEQPNSLGLRWMCKWTLFAVFWRGLAAKNRKIAPISCLQDSCSCLRGCRNGVQCLYDGKKHLHQPRSPVSVEICFKLINDFLWKAKSTANKQGFSATIIESIWSRLYVFPSVLQNQQGLPHGGCSWERHHWKLIDFIQQGLFVQKFPKGAWRKGCLWRTHSYLLNVM